MSRAALVAIALVVLFPAFGGVVRAKDRAMDRAKDRICIPADVARFEAMLGGIRKGQYRVDPRFALTIHYLGTTISKGTCNVQLRLAD